MKTTKELLELLLFAANEKANEATKLKNAQKSIAEKAFWQGQYMAFNEFYSLLSNLKNHI